jgi:hypothetical protein
MRGFILGLGTLLVGTNALAADWYVSTKGSNENDGSQSAPFSEIDKALDRAKDGDVIHVAEGTYLGRGKTAAAESRAAVSVLGGYTDDFSGEPDPVKHPTILSGDNTAKGLSSGRPRLRIRAKSGDVKIDGLIFDMAPRNAYTKGGKAVVRSANPRTGSNASLDSPTLAVEAGGKVEISRCVVVNSTHTGIMLRLGKGSARVHHNWIVNTAGIGMELLSSNHGKDAPTIVADHNSVLFTWKYDAYGTRGGEGISVGSSANVTLDHNLIVGSDKYGIANGRFNKELKILDNRFSDNLVADYWEGDLYLKANELGDAKSVGETKRNTRVVVALSPDADWRKKYAARKLLDRNKIEAGVSAPDNLANRLRSLLGMNLRAADVSIDAEMHAPPYPFASARLTPKADVGAGAAAGGKGAEQTEPADTAAPDAEPEGE